MTLSDFLLIARNAYALDIWPDSPDGSIWKLKDGIRMGITVKGIPTSYDQNTPGEAINNASKFSIHNGCCGNTLTVLAEDPVKQTAPNSFTVIHTSLAKIPTGETDDEGYEITKDGPPVKSYVKVQLLSQT